MLFSKPNTISIHQLRESYHRDGGAVSNAIGAATRRSIDGPPTTYGDQGVGASAQSGGARACTNAMGTKHAQENSQRWVISQTKSRNARYAIACSKYLLLCSWEQLMYAFLSHCQFYRF